MAGILEIFFSKNVFFLQILTLHLSCSIFYSIVAIYMVAAILDICLGKWNSSHRHMRTYTVAWATTVFVKIFSVHCDFLISHQITLLWLKYGKFNIYSNLLYILQWIFYIHNTMGRYFQLLLGIFLFCCFMSWKWVLK